MRMPWLATSAAQHRSGRVQRNPASVPSPTPVSEARRLALKVARNDPDIKPTIGYDERSRQSVPKYGCHNWRMTVATAAAWHPARRSLQLIRGLGEKCPFHTPTNLDLGSQTELEGGITGSRMMKACPIRSSAR